MERGKIVKALSGFYYVRWSGGVTECRARGKFRKDGVSPMVGDDVYIELSGDNTGAVTEILPRKNYFIRPAVANVDYLVILTANVNPVTDPFLADRVAVIAEHVGCGVIICINKCDLDRGDDLWNAFSLNTGYPVIRTSAVTGEGIAELRSLIQGKTAAFTGNSGVGKSSILNKLEPSLELVTAEVSERLGRGKHTTRHVELYDVGGTMIADTPGFSSFDLMQMQRLRKEELQFCFPEFREWIGHCRFDDCAHLQEPGCAVLEALESGKIAQTRHESYKKLFDLLSSQQDWERKDTQT